MDANEDVWAVKMSGIVGTPTVQVQCCVGRWAPIAGRKVLFKGRINQEGVLLNLDDLPYKVVLGAAERKAGADVEGSVEWCWLVRVTTVIGGKEVGID